MNRPVTALLLLLGVLSVNSFAAPKKVPEPTRGAIVSINLAAHTVTLTPSPKATPETYTLTDQTTIEIGNKPAPVSHIRAGMLIKSIRVGTGQSPEVEDLDLM